MRVHAPPVRHPSHKRVHAPSVCHQSHKRVRAPSVRHPSHGMLLRVAATAAAAAAAAGAAPAPGVVITEVGGAVTDGSAVWDVFAMANYPGDAWPRSYALSDTGAFGRLAWGIGGGNPLGVADYATQGSLIAEKLLALGTDTTRSVVRAWLAKVPLTDDGRAFGTEGSEFHGGGQGAFEGNAEVLLIARHYAAHTGDRAAFATVAERLVCYTDAGGAAHLAGAPHPGLDDAACGQTPSALLARSASLGWRLVPESAWLAPYNQTIGNATLRKVVHAHGKAPLQYVDLPAPASALSFALVTGAPPASRWPLVVTVVDTAAGNAAVRNGTLDTSGSGSGWATFDVTDPASGAPLPAGSYAVVIGFDPLAGAGGGGKLALPQWVTDVAPGAQGGSAYQTFLGWDAADPLAQWATGPGGSVVLPPARPLAAQLQAALWWQLNNAVAGGGQGYDVLAITDPIFRGSDEAAVNSGCSYYDLFRMGFVASYINLRFLESLLAYQELQAAGFVPASDPAPGELAATVGQVRASLTARFATPGDGGILAWYGCTCANATATLCPVGDAVPGTSAPCVQVWDLGFLPAQALAVKLGVGDAATVADRLAVMRDAARVVPGAFRTNTVPFEAVSPSLWLAADRWALKDAGGFALRSANQTGDWMLFDPAAGAADGNGNYGLQEENGGVLLSTAAFVMEVGGGGNATAPPDPGAPFLPRAGPYPGIYRDWAGLVGALGNVSAQLAAGDTAAPLADAAPGYLRAPINASLVQALCAAPRGPGALTNKDPWGRAWCDYYKSVSFDLPEAGLPLWSFARGLLGLYVDAGGGLSVLGSPVPVPSGANVTVPLPAGWPAEVAAVAVHGLAAGAARGVSLACAVGGGGAQQVLQCAATLAARGD